MAVTDASNPRGRCAEAEHPESPAQSRAALQSLGESQQSGADDYLSRSPLRRIRATALRRAANDLPSAFAVEIGEHRLHDAIAGLSDGVSQFRGR